MEGTIKKHDINSELPNNYHIPYIPIEDRELMLERIKEEEENGLEWRKPHYLR